MIISKETKYSDFAPLEKYLKPAEKEKIKAAAEACFKSMADLTFGEYWSACNGHPEAIIGDYREPSVLQVYWLQRLREFTNELARLLKNLQPPRTATEMQAADALRPCTFAESVLIFLRSYFALPSFRDAEKITIGELLIAKKDAYNTAMYQRKLAAIQAAEMKRKK